MRYKASVLVLVTILLGGPCLAQQAPAQRQPSPEEMQKIMDATMGAMVPMMGRMMEVMLEAQLKVAALPDTAERVATFKKNLYDALQAKGFSKPEALQILNGAGLTSADP